jgi:hypothetical protein
MGDKVRMQHTEIHPKFFSENLKRRKEKTLTQMGR